MNVRSLARSLGGDVVARDQVLVPGPGHSRHDRSLAVFIDSNSPDLFRVFSHCGDDWKACRDHVKARLGIDVMPKTPAQKVGVSRPEPVIDDDRDRIIRALTIWGEAVSIDGTVALTYLANRRIDIGRLPRLSHAIRFHCRCPFRLNDGQTVRLPAMVGLFRDARTDEPTGIHRTALMADGSGKADLPALGNPKKMLGRAKGAAIKLSPDEDVTEGLGIAEGMETGLTILATGWAPLWVCGSAGAIASFPTLAGIECLTIFADADAAGQKAAAACADQWQRAGAQALIEAPHD